MVGNWRKILGGIEILLRLNNAFRGSAFETKQQSWITGGSRSTRAVFLGSTVSAFTLAGGRRFSQEAVLSIFVIPPNFHESRSQDY